jgi:hypothetical protein
MKEISLWRLDFSVNKVTVYKLDDQQGQGYHPCTTTTPMALGPNKLAIQCVLELLPRDKAAMAAANVSPPVLSLRM